jgi:predicted nuclease of predicted toxin-antitoxin system
MKILIDMNLSPAWAKTLKDAGFDAIHWSEFGLATAPDPEILAAASKNRFIILTNDLDFGAALVLSNQDKASVVQIRSDDLRPAVIGGLVCKALCQMKVELETGALLTIEPARTRLRLLPLQKDR